MENFHATSLFIVTIIGLIVGSFLNVVIYRLPIMLYEKPNIHSTHNKIFNLFLPRSFCPKCHTKIPWFNNIPLLSFVFLRGKCSVCGKKISWRYISVELISSISSICAVLFFGFTWQSLAAIAFGWFLIVLIFIDFDYLVLPDQLTLGLLWLGLICSTFGWFSTPSSAIIGAFFGYITLWLIAKIFQLVRHIEGMGYGDFKLFAALGAWFGWQRLPAILLISSLLGVTVGLILILMKKHKFNKPLPFGPYLAIAGWCSLFLIHTRFYVN